MRYHGPIGMRITNNSHELTYKFLFADSRIFIKRPVVSRFASVLRFWRQDFVGFKATVLSDLPRVELTDYALPPLESVELLVEFDREFPDTELGIPPYSQSVFRVPMVGRIRRIERAVSNLKLS